LSDNILFYQKKYYLAKMLRYQVSNALYYN